MIDNAVENKRRLLNKGYLLGYILIAIIALFMLIIYQLKTGQMDVGIVGIALCFLGILHAVRGIVHRRTEYWVPGFGFVLLGLYYIFRYIQLLLI